MDVSGSEGCCSSTTGSSAAMGAGSDLLIFLSIMECSASAMITYASKLSPPRLKLPNCMPTFSTPLAPPSPGLALPKPMGVPILPVEPPNRELGIITGESACLYLAATLDRCEVVAGLAVLAGVGAGDAGTSSTGGTVGSSAGVAAISGSGAVVDGSASGATCSDSGSATSSSVAGSAQASATVLGSSSHVGACAVAGSSHSWLPSTSVIDDAVAAVEIGSGGVTESESGGGANVA